MKTELNTLCTRAEAEFASVADTAAWNDLRVRYLGRKSQIQELLKGLGKLDKAERPAAGQLINETRQQLEAFAAAAETRLQQAAWDNLAEDDAFDVTEPPAARPRGGRHPLSILREEVEDLFLSMGFDVLDGPEIESEFHNFEALNIPSDHPARDMQDTFWLESGDLLRTHTSPVQVRTMLLGEPPFRGIAPGRVFRYEELDASHEHTFHQVEGLLVDRDVSAADLVGVVTTFLSRLFGRSVEVRLRPGYFPFVEPGFEVDFSCLLCSGQGCPACKRTGWLEFMGSGVVHPNVLKACGLDPARWSGFAFGFGLERLAMMRWNISDIRHFQSGDLRFLEQFS